MARAQEFAPRAHTLPRPPGTDGGNGSNNTASAARLRRGPAGPNARIYYRLWSEPTYKNPIRSTRGN